MLLFCLTTKTYLTSQLLLYMPRDLLVDYPTCSFWLFHSHKPFILTCPLTGFKYLQIFIKQIVPFGVFLTWHFFSPRYKLTHSKINQVAVNFDASFFFSFFFLSNLYTTFCTQTIGDMTHSSLEDLIKNFFCVNYNIQILPLPIHFKTT